MKKITLSIALAMLATCAFAQKDSLSKAVEARSAAIGHTGNNELKVNMFYLVLGLPEISYERLLSDNMGLGLSATVGIENNQSMRYAFLTSYRLYFGNKKANGFFIEGNAGVVTEQRSFIIYVHEYENFLVTRKNKAYFGMGAAAGAKFLTRKGFLGEAYVGAGRMLGNSNSDLYPRVGITIGKRF